HANVSSLTSMRSRTSFVRQPRSFHAGWARSNAHPSELHELLSSRRMAAKQASTHATLGGRCRASHDQRRRMRQRLIHDTVLFSQAHQVAKLLVRGIGVERDLQANALKSDGRVLAYT